MSAIFIGCSDKNISESLEMIKASQISAISAQMTSIRASISKLETVDSELNNLISSIREGMDVEDGNDYGMEKVIQKLERTDVTLKQRIVDLKEYCDSPENQTSGWTATTYLTLEKHNAVLTEIADLNNTLVSELLTVIGDVDSSCSKKIAAERAKLQDEIKDLETSLKDWVSEQLSGYYTIAEVEAKLKACEEGYKAGDEGLKVELATLRQALETAKTELTSAYQDAIAAAITENNGKIDQKIASDIKAATDTLQEQIASLSTRLDALESRVADLEATVAKIISMVQSVVVVPDYSDGSVAMSRVEDNKVRFEVYPLSAAESIAKIGTSILSFDYVETVTKSSEEFVKLPITAVEFTGKTLLLTVDGNNLPESVLDPGTSSSANARLLISDGTSICSSEYFPIYKKESGSNPENGVAITSESSDISESAAKLFGLCNQSGVEGASVVYGIEFSSTDLTTNVTRLEASEKDADNKYYCVANNLSSNTLYYYRAFTLFNGVMTYGEIKSFTTLDISATVSTEQAVDITELGATLNGSLVVDSKESFDKSVWFLYSDSANNLDELKTSGARVSATLSNDGTFTRAYRAFKYNTTYYYVACATVYDKTIYGEVKSFTTLDFSATVSTGPAADITWRSAELSGSISISSVETLSQSVAVYYSNTKSDLAGLMSSGSKAVATLNNGTFSCSLSYLSSSTTYYYVAVATVVGKTFDSEVKSFSTVGYPLPEAVDLGLSVKWSSCNLGAYKPEEYGGIYQWAGTIDVSNPSILLDWSYCPYHTGSERDSGWTKYNDNSYYGTVDNKTTLEASDDAAAVNLGGSWRMPTDAEWEELRNPDNCSCTLIKLNGVTGYKVQSKKAGFTDNWIFLPAAGSKTWGYDVGGFGIDGNYWSSSLDTNSTPSAYFVYFGSGYLGRMSHNRFFGKSVRPVSN